MPTSVVSSGVSRLPSLCMHRSHVQPLLSKPHCGRRIASQTSCKLQFPQCQRAKSPLSRKVLPKLRRLPPVSAAGSAAFELSSQQEVRQKAAARVKTAVPRPADLPPPPKSTSLLHVLPYLTKLAVSDAQLYWRLGLAFVLMVSSKAAGRNAFQGIAGTVEQALLCFRAGTACLTTSNIVLAIKQVRTARSSRKEPCRSHGASIFQESGRCPRNPDSCGRPSCSHGFAMVRRLQDSQWPFQGAAASHLYSCRSGMSHTVLAKGYTDLLSTA